MPRLFAVPLPWRKKKFDTVSVDYKFGQTCGNSKFVKTTNINDAVLNARLWLIAVDAEIAKPPGQWSAEYVNSFMTYFGIDPRDGANQAHVDEVRQVVRATMNGAANPLHVASICRWRGGETATQGYVKTHSGNTKGRIHVALPQFSSVENSDRVEQTCIIVHEATHKFADTTDASYLGKSDFPPNSIVDALECADCYTYFIRDAVQARLEKNSWAFWGKG